MSRVPEPFSIAGSLTEYIDDFLRPERPVDCLRKELCDDDRMRISFWDLDPGEGYFKDDFYS